MAQFYSMCSSVNTVSLKIKIKRKKNCKDNVHSRVCQIIIIMHRYLRHVATVLAAAAAAAVELALVHRRCMESALDYACLIERLSLLIVSRTHRRRQRDTCPTTVIGSVPVTVTGRQCLGTPWYLLHGRFMSKSAFSDHDDHDTADSISFSCNYNRITWNRCKLQLSVALFLVSGE